MTDLTEKWKKGELPSADENHTWLAYYLKQASGRIHADSYWRGNWGHADRNSIIEVLAPVPSYDHFVELTEKVKENQQLKELLKECREFFEEENPKDFTVISERMDDLLTKIDNATGEKK